jgi:hypothetical protein
MRPFFYDPVAKVHMAPPIAQKKLLRKSKFQHFDAITLWCEKQLVVPAVVEA